MTTPGLNLLYVHASIIGYARYGTSLAAALTRMGVEVTDTLGREDLDIHGDPIEVLNQKIHNVVCWISTPAHARGWYKDQYPVLSTMWEATTLPEAFRESLDDFELIIVPSEQNKKLFSRYHSNVKKVWLGVDTNVWKPVERKPPEERFNFLIGGSGTRKGTDLAYRAFKKVFRTWPADMPTPYLIMKSPKPEDFYGERIERIGGRISDRAERDLYAMAHCYLQPSRGEGWGLQPMQAMATGCPTILTNAHGHAEFADYAIPINKYTMKESDYFIYGDAGLWWEPDFDELCEHMWDVYLNYAVHLKHAEQVAVDVIPRLFSWDTCAHSFAAAIGEPLNQPYTGDGDWVVTERKLYLVRVNRAWQADIAGIHHQFVPGVDYREVADVKRILFDAGLLDPSCVVSDPSGPLSEIEIGLAPSQIDAAVHYQASHSYCWSCGQMLNSGTLYQP